MNAFRFRELLRSSLWAIPALFVVIALALAVALAFVERPLTSGVSWLRFPGPDDTARSILSAIAGAMITFTGLVFSITVLVLQLASQQYSPRVLRTFLGDRTSKVSLGMFAATFAYTIAVLWRVAPDDVPGLSIGIAIVLVLISLGVFVNYISHIANSIQVSSIIDRVAAETRETIEGRFGEGRQDETSDGPLGGGRDAPVEQIVRSEAAGMVQSVDVEGLTRVARDAGVVVELRSGVGDFVPQADEIVAVRGGRLDDEALEDVVDAVTIGRERTPTDDVAFGLRQLADIAQRALSPSLNDPTTAVQAIDHLHDLLRRLARSAFPASERLDEDGEVRVIVIEPTWDDYVTLAVTEVRRAGKTSVQVLRRLRAMLEDLRDLAPPDRRAPIERELALVAANADALAPRRDAELSQRGDAQALGGAA